MGSSESTESNSDSKVESSDVKDVKTNPDDNTSGERRTSSDDKLPSATSDRKDGASSTVSKRLSPADKLKETLLSFEKSLDMLLVDLAKENLAGDDDEEMEQKTKHFICFNFSDVVVPSPNVNWQIYKRIVVL